MGANTVADLPKRRCRECGEWFTPRSKNQIYCDKLHYRPCPVCGKPVEAKYLSDPARCCSNECKAIARKKKQEEEKSKRLQQTDAQQPKVKPLKKLNPEDANYEEQLREISTVKTYIFSRTICGFTKGHEYAIEINQEKGSYVYDIAATYDFTEHKHVDLLLNVASMASFSRYFK